MEQNEEQTRLNLKKRKRYSLPPEVIIAELNKLEPSSDKQAALRHQFIDYAEQTTIPTARANWHGHFTVTAGILHPTKPLIAMTEHGHTSEYYVPGGHMGMARTPHIAAWREASERTGLSFKYLKPVKEEPVFLYNQTSQRDPNPAHTHMNIGYIFQAQVDFIKDQNHANKTAWTEPDAAIKRLGADEPVAGFVRLLAQRFG